MSRYQEALAWLYGLESRGIKLGLSRMEAALALRGDPHEGLRYLHVAGTNGKGSVCAMAERSLRAAGHKTGWFSSPHLHRYVERVRIGGRPLSEKEMASRIFSLRDDARLPPLTFFEYTTLAAFEAFRDHGCDVVVLEVGLGGRLDSTNVVTPTVSVITQLALDHTHILGNSLRAIAKEKAGIVKPGAPLVTSVRDRSALAVLRARAKAAGVPLSRLGADFQHQPSEQSAGRARGRRIDVRVGEHSLLGLRLSLDGAFQPENAACAVAALIALREGGLSVPDEAIRAGLARVRWPGRMESISAKRSRVGVATLIDAAHNPEGCVALAAELRRRLGEQAGRAGAKKNVVLLFGAMVDKEHAPMLACFDGLVSRRVYVTPGVQRAAKAATFKALRPGVVADSVSAGIERAAKLAGPEGLMVVAGSIHLLGEVRAEILGLRQDPPIAM